MTDIAANVLLRLDTERWTDRVGGYVDADNNVWAQSDHLLSASSVTIATLRGSNPFSFSFHDAAGVWKRRADDNQAFGLDVELWLLEDGDPPVKAYFGFTTSVDVDVDTITIRCGSFMLGLDVVKFQTAVPEGGVENTVYVWKSDT